MKRRAFLGVVATGALVGCKDVDVAEWTEDLQLSDGRLVQVQRKERAAANGFPNAKRGRDLERSLGVTMLGVTWQHTVTAQSVRVPIALDVVDGQIQLVVEVVDRNWCAGRPPTQYAAEALTWINGSWSGQPLQPALAARMKPNLHTAFWGGTPERDTRGHLSLDQKQVTGDAGDTLKSFLERAHRVCQFRQTS